jgi:hypothetical protein
MADESVAPGIVKDLSPDGRSTRTARLNGRIRTRSPLGDVIELETTLTGVTTKAAFVKLSRTSHSEEGAPSLPAHSANGAGPDRIVRRDPG